MRLISFATSEYDIPSLNLVYAKAVRSCSGQDYMVNFSVEGFHVRHMADDLKKIGAAAPKIVERVWEQINDWKKRTQPDVTTTEESDPLAS